MGETFEARLMRSTLAIAANSCSVALQISNYLVLNAFGTRVNTGSRRSSNGSDERSSTGHRIRDLLSGI